MAVGGARNLAEKGVAAGVELLAAVDSVRREATLLLDPRSRSELGQFLTPAPVAKFMADMFHARRPRLRVLDPGAGVGSLSAAFVAEMCARSAPPEVIELTAYELDPALESRLRTNLDLCRQAASSCGVRVDARVVRGDFIEAAIGSLATDLFATRTPESYDCVIMNPPYRKIRSDSPERLRLRDVGIESSNLYSAFLALAARLLVPNGEMVAITPRSFCNGPYFEHFRHLFLGLMRFRRVHVFDSRDEAFSEDGVLQENVVFHAERTTKTALPNVIISSSHAPSDPELRVRRVNHDDIVSPADRHAFIHIVPDFRGDPIRDRVGCLEATLDDLGLNVSTGRVVDFRAQDHLRDSPEPGSVPLIYPCHLERGRVVWPNARNRKPNAIMRVADTEELLVVSADYVLVKRFSAKEERRRLTAAVFDASMVPADVVGFENHLNYFHQNGRGLPAGIARGLSAFLNSTIVDEYFRQFSGHTQVNATDLRSLRYPSIRELQALTARLTDTLPDQEDIDRLIDEVLFVG
jgi:adenine-specific DNA-methyltransferase